MPPPGRFAGRLECGNRQGSLKFVARFASGSTELASLKNQTTGTAVIVLQYDANNKLTVTFHKVSFSAAEVRDTDGFNTDGICQ